jgi:DNA-binding Lrp family transcriptional regulator
LDGVVGLYAFLGGVLCVMVTSRSPADLERKLRVLVGLAGEGKLAKFYDLTMPTVGRPLSNLDWRIIQALRGDAMKPLPKVAKDVGVSAKTVKRRFDQMSEEGSFFVTPQLDPSQAEGVLLFYLGFYFDSEGGRGVVPAIHKAYDSVYISYDAPQNIELGSYALMVAANSMGEVEKLRKKGAQIRGVAKVAPWLFRDVQEKYDWIDEAIAERVKSTST